MYRHDLLCVARASVEQEGAGSRGHASRDLYVRLKGVKVVCSESRHFPETR